MSQHGKGCTCAVGLDNHDDWFCRCPWHTQDVDFDHIPFSLERCEVCMSLLEWGSGPRHMKWHEGRGDLDEPLPAD